MTLRSKPHHARSRVVRHLGLAIVVGSLCGPGCDSPKRAEVSAETSGYLPSNNPPSAPKQAASEQATTDAPAPNNVAGEASAESNPTPKLPEAPKLPDFNVGKPDQALAAKSFMTLKPPADLTNAATLLDYLSQNTIATKDLILELQQKNIPQDQALARALELGRDKVNVAEALVSNSDAEEDHSVGAIAKMEALMQMASLGDVLASDDLVKYVEEQSKSKLPAVAQQALGIHLTLKLDDFAKDRAQSAEIQDLIGKFIQTGEPDMRTLQIAGKGIELLRAKTDELQPALAKNLYEKFSTSESESPTELALASFQLLAHHTPSFNEFLQATSSDSPDLNKPDVLREKVKRAIADLPHSLTLFMLLRDSTNVEYGGFVDAAKVIISEVESNLAAHADDAGADEIRRFCEGFHKRVGCLGSELDLAGLVDMDGKPFDFAQYAGKIVVVDFWATWCGPCLQEMPHMKRLLEERQSQGVEILGINLDDNRESLKSFLQTDPLPWNTVISADPQKVAFETEAVTKLGITAIPFIAIVGRDGKVAAIHVRGRKLEQKIDELLAATPQP